MSDLVVVIPARGGSKRIKGKNIRPLAGKPLVHHAIDYALELEPQHIIVSTDSDEVAGVVKGRYPDVLIDRSFQHTDETTVDEVTSYVYDHFIHKGETLVTIQPTMIGDVVENLQNVLPVISKHGGAWRLSGMRIVSAPVNVKWGWENIWSNTGIRTDTTLIDIDTMADFAAAELYLRKQTTINILYKAGEKQGWGHQKRAEALADALQDYDVTCMNVDGAGLEWSDITILDVGDTTERMVKWYTANEDWKVITIEDDGPGAQFANASINPFNDLKYAILRPEFYNLPEYEVRDTLEKVMISFGGQSNHGVGQRVLQTLAGIAPQIITPSPHQMAATMLDADVLFCAGGQTAYEAIKVGVPTVVIPALPTEAMRPHIGPENGIINLGITATDEMIAETYWRLMKDKMLREDMSRRMKATRVGDGIVEIRRIIEDLCQR